MKLSEVADSGLDAAHGVVFDGVDLFPRPTVTRLTILAAAEDGELDQDLIDTLIAYKSLRVDVGIEVPFGSDLDPFGLLRIAGPLGLDIRLIPPAAGEPAQEFLSTVRRYAALVPTVPTMAQPVQPVADALGAIVRRRLEQRIDIPLEGDFGGIDPELVLLSVRSGFEDSLGGSEAFDEYVDLHVAGIIEDSRRRLAEHVRAQAAETPPPTSEAALR